MPDETNLRSRPSRTAAVIDMGSNSIRLSFYSIADGGFSRLLSKKNMAGLAGYVKDGRLDDEGISCACEALLSFKKILSSFPTDYTAVFATASLRNISNSEQAKSIIERSTGFDIEIISGKREALLGFDGFQYDCRTSDGTMVDIGGGSTEIVRFEDGKPFFATSLETGSLKLFRQCVSGILPTADEMTRMRGLCMEKISSVETAAEPPSAILCGIGGTSRAVNKFIAHDPDTAEPSNSFSVTRLHELSDLLQNDSSKRRERILKICPDRVHTIIPGVLILETVADIFGCSSIRVSDFGVREGYVYRRIHGEDGYSTWQ